MRISDLSAKHPLGGGGNYTTEQLTWAGLNSKTMSSPNGVVIWGDSTTPSFVMLGRSNPAPYLSTQIFSGAIEEFYGCTYNGSTAFAVKQGGVIYTNTSDPSYGIGGRTSNLNTFQPFSGVNHFSAGSSLGAIIKSDGCLYTVGYAGSGQLGNGSSSGSVLTYAKIGTDTDWSKVYCIGNYSCVALKQTGTLWYWGSNTYGPVTQTGNTLVPTQVGTDTWSAIYPGMNQCYLKRSDGTIWSFGQFQYNRGNGTASSGNYLLTQMTTAKTDWTKLSVAGNVYGVALDSVGDLYYCGPAYYGFAAASVFTKIRSGVVDIAAYSSGFLYLKSDGSLMICGPKQLAFSPGTGSYSEYKIATIPPTSKIYSLNHGSSAQTFVVAIQ